MECLVTAPLPHFIYEKGGKTYPVPYHGSKEIGKVGIFTNAALEKITGINQRQLQHYSSGLKKPRQPQLKKIEEGLHRLAAELQAVELV